MWRPAAAVAAGVVSLAVLVACDGGDSDDWDPEAQFAPSLRPAAGVRITDDRLVVWTGTPCQGVTRVALSFEADDEEVAELVLRAAEPGVTVQRVRPEGRNRGLRVEEQLPDGFDPETADTMRLSLYGGTAGWGTWTDLAEVRDGSAEHPVDTFYFEKVGWLDADGVAEQNGETFLTPCTPDPAKQ